MNLVAHTNNVYDIPGEGTIVSRDPTGKCIGDLSFDRRPGKTFEVHLDVLPEYQRMGIGKSLIAEVEKLAKSEKAMSLYTFMASDNEKAKGFFRTVGFELTYLPNFYGHGRHAYFGLKTIGKPE